MAKQNSKLKTSIKELNQEQENLLILLQDMEAKLKHYKHLLRNNGHTGKLSDSEDEDNEAEETTPATTSQLTQQFEQGVKLHEHDEVLENKSCLTLLKGSHGAAAGEYPKDEEYDQEAETNFEYQPNFISQIIEENNYSNPHSSNNTNSNENSDTSSTSNSSDNSHENYQASNAAPFAYPPPAGQNFTSLSQKPLKADAAVNPFFAQHPFFNAGLQQPQQKPTTSNNVQTY